MGSFRMDNEGLKAQMRHGRIIARAMEIDPSAFLTITVDGAGYDPGMYNLRHAAMAKATEEIDAELTADSQKEITAE